MINPEFLCGRCKVVQPLEAFVTRTGRTRAYCKKCASELAMDWAKRNREKANLCERDYLHRLKAERPDVYRQRYERHYLKRRTSTKPYKPRAKKGDGNGNPSVQCTGT